MKNRGKIKKKLEESRMKYGILGVLFVIALLLGNSTLFATFDVSRYGDPVLYNETTDALMSAGDILSVQNGDTLVAWLVDDASTQHKPIDLDWTVTLRRADTNAWVETGGNASKVGELYPQVQGNSMRWWFNLESCSEGTFSYYVYWFAMIGDTELDVDGKSYSFDVVNSEEPTYGDAEFVIEPDTSLEFSVGQTPASITWKIGYDGSFTASIKVDGTEVWTNDYVASSGDEIFVHTIDTSIVGTQSIILTITPDVADNPKLVSDTVVVTIVAASTTTTTTTPTVPTNTTITTTTIPVIPIPLPDELDWTLIAVVVGVGILVGYVMMRRKSVPVSTQRRGY